MFDHSTYDALIGDCSRISVCGTSHLPVESLRGRSQAVWNRTRSSDPGPVDRGAAGAKSEAGTTFSRIPSRSSSPRTALPRTSSECMAVASSTMVPCSISLHRRLSCSRGCTVGSSGGCRDDPSSSPLGTVGAGHRAVPMYLIRTGEQNPLGFCEFFEILLESSLGEYHQHRNSDLCGNRFRGS